MVYNQPGGAISQGMPTMRYAWLVVALLWVVAFLNYLDRILITSMRDPIVTEFDLTDAQFGLLTSVFLWSYGFLSPLGGFIADRYSRKKVIVFSVLIWSIVTYWTGHVTSFNEMLIARILMGVSEACYIPAGLAMIMDYHRGKTSSLATGLHMSGLYAGLAFGGLGGYIAMDYGWRTGFTLFGGIGVVYAFLLWYFLKEHPFKNQQVSNDAADTGAIKNQDGSTLKSAPGLAEEPGMSSHESGTSQSAISTAANTGLPAAATEPAVVAKPASVSLPAAFKHLFSIRSFYFLLIYFTVLGMVNWLVNGWLPTFLKEHFSLDLGAAGISATGYIQVGSFIGVVLGGLLADRWVTKNQRGRLFVLIIGFTIGAPFLFLMASTSVFWIAIVAMVVFGMARGFNDSNLMPVLRQVADTRYIATGYGFLNLLSTIIGGAMVYVGGALKDADVSLSVTYQVAAVCMLLATWCLFWVRTRRS
ncbi:MAG: MFS transporter [Sphingobacteriales bacterium]|nr:MAG: MFS transporter [Sphingobacteriales bacterium]